ncbi:MAG: hypothetical protein M3041_04020 [Acidobacteriota bacterium]|nr:hypothetical protein [Acidobacteriota bacterium]
MTLGAPNCAKQLHELLHSLRAIRAIEILDQPGSCHSVCGRWVIRWMDNYRFRAIADDQADRRSYPIVFRLEDQTETPDLAGGVVEIDRFRRLIGLALNPHAC